MATITFKIRSFTYSDIKKEIDEFNRARTLNTLRISTRSSALTRQRDSETLHIHIGSEPADAIFTVTVCVMMLYELSKEYEIKS